ncbi:glycosyltransferase [Aequorivita sp. SDUM287046]|uniref:Glycosyltransferase n=1 Tax=Aequorivita aurantiaca TaxID=3053356 RepID=A0ABT8DI39_9FLAO|nr:glycosyltransferase [Aequorivita aurantiaca]
MTNFSSKDLIPETRFTVVIPFRNEAENLPHLLESIENIQYPAMLFEIILVNDASEDNSEAIIIEAMKKTRFTIKLIQNKRFSKSPKKDAITEAIQNSKFEWIVTTDADCKLSENWLTTLDLFIQKNNPTMVCGPVIYESDGSYIQTFQQLDGFSLQALTVGSFGVKLPLLCNGANLAYRKKAFKEVDGFLGNGHIASGDDIFLLEKMQKTFPGKVMVLKSQEAIVSTKPQKNWKNVINQRIRWASKTSKQKNPASILLGILIFLVNVSLLATPVLIVFEPGNWGFYFFLFYLKLISDFIFVKQSGMFFNKKISFWKFHLQSFTYSAVVFITVFGSVYGTYSWKGRSFEKQ